MTEILFDNKLSQDDIEMIAYLQLRDIEKGKIDDLDEKIGMLTSSLHYECYEAFGLLGIVLRDNLKKLGHYERMDILETLEKSKKVGCIEPLLDILEMFESMEPKSRYLYQQMSKIIDIIGKSKKRWLAPILRKYAKSSSRLIRDSAQNAILDITASNTDV